MEELACDPHAYHPPFPIGRLAGRRCRKTREAMHFCEAAGFDITFD